MQSLLDWLVTLPHAALYAIIFLSAAIENLFPPFPSDVLVAFGGFVVAQTPGGTMLAVFLAVWVGNVGGAMLVYFLGRRYGAERLERRLAGKQAASRDKQLRRMFDRFGLPAVFVSRFVPGVRALVPAFAGALKVSPLWILLMVASASAIWYGLITVIAFRVGSDWENLRETVTRYATVTAIVAGVILAVGLLTWLIVSKRRKTS
jgi:membrane protein DedA with SNARE-associated domain